MVRLLALCWLIAFHAGYLSATVASAAEPCRQAHAHNDYLHDRPLLDALDNGFCSVEADIYLIDGELLVAHDLNKTTKSRTLQSLYLDPLRTRVRQSGGSVHGDGQPITLLIDIKSEGVATYQALHKVLSGYQDILTSVDREGIHRGAVTVIISGNRAVEEIRADLPRYAGIDGRLSDLESDLSPDLLPLISDHWGRNFSWRGVGEMSSEDREKLKRVIEKAHADGRRVRFWATPDLKTVWAALADADVDLINTDDLTGLSQFLRH